VKVYRGEVIENPNQLVYQVTVDGRPLNPRHDIHNHSPDGFCWGYSGSGPAQLALALCADALQDDDRALAVYQHFKERTVARWGVEGKASPSWELSSDVVVEIVESIERELGVLVVEDLNRRERELLSIERQWSQGGFSPGLDDGFDARTLRRVSRDGSLPTVHVVDLPGEYPATWQGGNVTSEPLVLEPVRRYFPADDDGPGGDPE
jgi:hypothetical protein